MPGAAFRHGTADSGLAGLWSHCDNCGIVSPLLRLHLYSGSGGLADGEFGIGGNLSALIMTASKAIGTYGASATLGGIVGYSTIATRMYDMLATGSKGTGYVLALLMIDLSVVFLFVNQVMVGSRKSYETIGGKGTRSTLSSLGTSRTPVSVRVILFLVVALILPLLVLMAETFEKVPGAGYTGSNLTLYYWIGRIEDAGLGDLYPGLFRNPEFLNALWNTVKLSLITAVITAFFGQIFGYLTTRGRGKWHGKLIEQLVLRKSSVSVWHLCPAGDCQHGETFSFCQPGGDFQYDADRYQPGRGGGDTGVRILSEAGADRDSSGEKRIYLRISSVMVVFIMLVYWISNKVFHTDISKGM